ncbi:Fe-Mn family superoxide dismutase, partial [Pseudomonas viridiflava]|uniref:Fe-Mn family superoxide dismutase n=1 Tax=Pseudomonas viridiflava TaxID=33069 RepID=UPI0019D12BF1
ANLKAGVSDSSAVEFKKLVADRYGSYENWLADFKATGTTRGVGHAICYMDPITCDVNNHFIELHNDCYMPGYEVLLSMDVWEHAFPIDYSVA